MIANTLRAAQPNDPAPREEEAGCRQAHIDTVGTNPHRGLPCLSALRETEGEGGRWEAQTDTEGGSA